MDDCDAMPATAHSRRRRRKKTLTSHSTDVANRQDVELEREVDTYVNDWDPVNMNMRKRQRHIRGESNDPPSTLTAESAENDTMKKEAGGIISMSLPVLLHLREVGYPRRRPRHISDGIEFSALSSQWNSRILKTVQGGDNDESPTRHPAKSSAFNNSRWNVMQYSSPTRYGIGVRNNCHSSLSSDDKAASCCAGNTSTMSRSSSGENQLRLQVWRPYTRRKIPFSKLRTPLSDAILAIDRWGGYLIGVGSGDADSRCPHLSIKFYEVPSPARLQRQNHNQADKTNHIVSPLIHTVPLLQNECSIKDSSTRSIAVRHFSAPLFMGHNELASPAAEIPIQILLSDSGSVGVAFIQPAVQDEDVLGTIVIFRTPGRGAVDFNGSRMTKSFRLNNVIIGGRGSFTMRNALWPTTVIPTRTRRLQRKDSKEDGADSNFTPFLCRFIHRALSAYVLFNDEDDGFRITWITVADSIEDSEEVCANEASNSLFNNAPNSIRPTRRDIVAPSEGYVWQECLTDSLTGCRALDESNVAKPLDGLNIAFEVYLHVDALLSDIICRRQSSLFKKSPYHNQKVFFMPEFFYNLISASPDALKVMLVVTFSNREKMMHSTRKVPSALGVFVEVNLFDQSYSEVQWVQHPSCNDASSMKRWCNSLALNGRIKQCRLGVFCLDSSEIGQHLANWNCSTHECNVDEDLTDDYNIKLWRNYVERRYTSKESIAPPKDISMSSLYPHCDVITNRAVHDAIPVKRIVSRSSPIELIYG